MANRQAVAEIAKVSTATVSNVLNNRKKVSPEIRERVIRAAKELDYQIIQKPFVNKIREAAFIVNDSTNPHHGKILSSMNNIAQKNGWIVSMLEIVGDPDGFCQMLIDRGTNAVFITTLNGELAEKHFNVLEEAGIYVVFSYDKFLVDFDSAILKGP